MNFSLQGCREITLPPHALSGKEQDQRSFCASLGVYCDYLIICCSGRGAVYKPLPEQLRIHNDRRTQWEKSCLASRYHWMDLSQIKMMTHRWYSHGWEVQWNVFMKSWAMRSMRTVR